MSFDATITFGNMLTIASLVIMGCAAIIAVNRWQVTVDAKLHRLEEGKVSREDCLRSHTDVLTREVFEAQTDKLRSETLAGAEKLAIGLSALVAQVAAIEVNQSWMMDALKFINVHGIKAANPSEAELPPDPRERAKDDWEAQEE